MRSMIILPGLGDRDWLYRCALPFWWLMGFRAQVHGLNWSHDDGDFAGRFQALQAHIKSLPGKVVLVGGSAGGPMAVAALLALPDKVARVAAISSPLAVRQHSTHSTLIHAMAYVHPRLLGADTTTIRRIASFRGRADSVVPPYMSFVEDAHNQVLPGTRHTLIIAMALTIFSWRIGRWLRRGR